MSARIVWQFSHLKTPLFTFRHLDPGGFDPILGREPCPTTRQAEHKTEQDGCLVVWQVLRMGGVQRTGGR